MTTYDTTVSVQDWYGGDAGYGIETKRTKTKKRFASVNEALRWAYSEVYKYRDKPKGRNTKVTRCDIDLDNGEYYYRIQLNKYKVRVFFARQPNGMLSRGFLLNKDGTINFRGGGIA